MDYTPGPFQVHPELPRASGGANGGANGIRDVVTALEWVQNHIADFGGDSARVTVMGESSGGLAVCVLVASPAARGLASRHRSHPSTTIPPFSHVSSPAVKKNPDAGRTVLLAAASRPAAPTGRRF